MSQLRDLVQDLQDEVERGELSFPEIANKYEVPLSWVYEAHESVQSFHDELERDHDERYEPDYDDPWYDEQYELDDSAF